MADADLTVTVLREIRDEIRGSNTRLDGTNTRIDHLEASLGGRIDETNNRLSLVEHTLQDLATQQVMLGRYVRNSSDRQETAVEDLRERVGLIETKLGI
jgi:hypothetical protein